MISPNHVAKYCHQIKINTTFYNIKMKYDGDYTFVYQIKCNCGCNEFKIILDRNLTTEGVCCNCGNIIKIYDLDCYPNATKVFEDAESEKRKLCEDNEENFQICVLYEYSDEFEFDDENFDVNDITAFALFVYCPQSKKNIMVFQDETA